VGWKLKHRQPDAHEILPHFEIGPVGNAEDVMAFDRRMCEQGCTRFMRDLTDFDAPRQVITDLRRQGYTQVTVEELRPGVRRRCFVMGYVIKRRDLSPN
jgi:hypothetical protein